MRQRQVDLAVLGLGPAGQKVLYRRQSRKKVVVVDAVDHLGGACLNQYYSSKALREAILDLTGFRNRSYYGTEDASNISINDLNFRLHKVIEDQNGLIARQFAKNDIECVHGFGRFIKHDCIEVVDHSGEVIETMCADRFRCDGLAPTEPGWSAF